MYVTHEQAEAARGFTGLPGRAMESNSYCAITTTSTAACRPS